MDVNDKCVVVLAASPINVRFSPESGIVSRGCDVRFVPKADILRCSEERRCSIASPAATK
jgi:hypothetical protein